MSTTDIRREINRAQEFSVGQKRTLQEAYDQTYYDFQNLEDIVTDGMSGTGIRHTGVPGPTPEYGWRDILGQIDTRVGATNPTWTIINAGPFYAYKFDVNDECWIPYHIPHDYVPGSDFYLHVHWLPSGTATQVVKWEWYYAYAAGFNQAAFSTAGTLVNAQAAGPGVAYRHMVTETVAISGAAITEPDGFLMTRLRRVTNGGVNNADSIFVLTADVHYQSTNLSTPGKAPGFYNV